MQEHDMARMIAPVGLFSSPDGVMFRGELLEE